MFRCMKDGAIAELGTHEELMRLGGEYAKLYDIQANAFRADNMVLDVSFCLMLSPLNHFITQQHHDMTLCRRISEWR
ncbi:hypothetical protein L208DRAFT_1404082 [Tricholoma matsutake]|nr:hypothetical protein L208DRAFT_1404082 [Tricholoma matsutake 945]